MIKLIDIMAVYFYSLLLYSLQILCNFISFKLSFEAYTYKIQYNIIQILNSFMCIAQCIKPSN